MKAIYIKPEAEVVYLQLEKDIADEEWQAAGKHSVTPNHTANTGFFGDDNNGNDSFFDK